MAVSNELLCSLLTEEASPSQTTTFRSATSTNSTARAPRKGPQADPRMAPSSASVTRKSAQNRTHSCRATDQSDPRLRAGTPPTRVESKFTRSSLTSTQTTSFHMTVTRKFVDRYSAARTTNEGKLLFPSRN